MDGPFPSPPSGVPEYECRPPHCRFFDMGDRADLTFEGFYDLSLNDMLKRMSPGEGTSAEEVIRQVHKSLSPLPHGILFTLDYLRSVIEEEGPFDGVIAASEGAVAASTLLLYEQQRCKEGDYSPTFKCGIFFVGFPPVKIDGTGLFLSDETDERITIPTCHVNGRRDPLWFGSETLWNVCEPSSRTLIMHEEGHIVPQNAELVIKILDFLRTIDQIDTQAGKALVV
ncbi:MAG: hypothetical protein M4579_006487 [Chaenotheca gracillima]|nr:MAG: hypothetical protein M4579_006487 [Chaenotheca gracillima]